MTFRIDDDSHKRIPQNKLITERIAGEGVEVMTRNQSYERLLIVRPNPPTATILAAPQRMQPNDTRFPYHNPPTTAADTLNGITFCDVDEYFYAVQRDAVNTADTYVVRSRLGDVWERVGVAFPTSWGIAAVFRTQSTRIWLISASTSATWTSRDNGLTWEPNAVGGGTWYLSSVTYSWFHDTIYVGTNVSTTDGFYWALWDGGSLASAVTNSDNGFAGFRVIYIIADRRKATACPGVTLIGDDGSWKMRQNNGSRSTWGAEVAFPVSITSGVNPRLSAQAVAALSSTLIVAAIDIAGGGAQVVRFDNNGAYLGAVVFSLGIDQLFQHGTKLIAIADTNTDLAAEGYYESTDGINFNAVVGRFRVFDANPTYGGDIAAYPVAGFDPVLLTNNYNTFIIRSIDALFSTFENYSFPVGQGFTLQAGSDFDGTVVQSSRPGASQFVWNLITDQVTEQYDNIPIDDPDSVVENGGVLVAGGRTLHIGSVSPGQQLVRSTDGGVTWSLVGPVFSSITDQVYDIVVISGTFIVFCSVNGSTFVILTSTDGLTWTQRSISGITSYTNYHPRDSLDGLLWVSHASQGTVVSFNSGVSWTAVTLPVGATYFNDMVLFNGNYYAINATTDLVYRSADLVNWSVAYDMTSLGGVYNLVNAGTALVVTPGSGSVVAWSRDGESWSTLDTGLTDLPLSVSLAATDGSGQVIVGKDASSVHFALISNL